MRKYLLHIICACLLGLQASAQADTLQVFFDTDDPFLNSKATKFLQRNYEKVDAQKDILIIGYADERGDVYYNDMLSMRRAQSVARFLEEKGFSRDRMKLVYGKGKVNRSDGSLEVYVSDRRVDVISGKLPEKKKVSRFKDTVGMPELEQIVRALPVNRAFRLENINFFLASPRPTPSSYPTMKELLRVMKSFPTLKIRLEGHICCIDVSDPRQIIGGKTLSLARANALAKYLVDNGIAKDRIQTDGFGKTRPLVKEERYEADRLANRRVEVRIIAK